MSHSHASAAIREGQFACKVCGRVHDKPREGDPAVICPCGYCYACVDGRLVAEFRNPF